MAKKNKKLPSILVKLCNKKGEVVDSIKTNKKMKVLYFVQKELFAKVILKVSYTHGAPNVGEYDNFKDFRQALLAFTEKALLDDYM